MKKLLVLFMAITLTGCSSAEASTSPAPEPDGDEGFEPAIPDGEWVPETPTEGEKYLNDKYPVDWDHVDGDDYTARHEEVRYYAVIGEDGEVTIEFDYESDVFQPTIMEMDVTSMPTDPNNANNVLFNATIFLQWRLHESMDMHAKYIGTRGFTACNLFQRPSDANIYNHYFGAVYLADNKAIEEIYLIDKSVTASDITDTENIEVACGLE